MHFFLFQGLKITALGKAHVRWTERHGSGKNEQTSVYTGEEEYLHFKVYLLCNGI